ncbi:protein GLUTELIN PRECURSOR ACCUMULATION 3 isoform X2 [Gouania willdenowi]|uniref:protein GLUTELIN PRECURSOR ACCUMULATION 3 isoform X2 n=1 Tax=Gouania willdenowi TaxID=441366 RepID=UPI0010559231|nr:protein GLUTELIN PRECURSOR ACCUMULATION 3-like isoform X2 [Gouania willdenowi]
MRGSSTCLEGCWTPPTHAAHLLCGCLISVYVYVPVKQKWVLCQGKTSSPKVPSNRKGHSAVVLGSTMLVYGGFVDIRGSSQDFWALDFDTMSWSLLNSSQHDSAGPGPRHSHSAVVYQSCMYLYGGLKGLREQKDLWRWNSCSFTWTCMKNMSGPPRLIGHSAALYNDHMLVFGGGQSVDCPQSSLWSYSFTSHTWTQVASLPGSTAPTKIHHCSTGLGPSYRVPSTTCSMSPLQQGRARPFQNRCYPAPQSSPGLGGDIELETFSTSSSTLDLSTETEEDLMTLSCLSFENKAFRKQWSCTEEELMVEEEEDGDISLHLPDQLLVLGGRPCVRHQLISVWQMTLTHS